MESADAFLHRLLDDPDVRRPSWKPNDPTIEAYADPEHVKLLRLRALKISAWFKEMESLKDDHDVGSNTSVLQGQDTRDKDVKQKQVKEEH